MKNFEGFGLDPQLARSLAHMKYTTPTPIQARAIPVALKGHDIMGSAQTGTGKTAAFAIPLIQALLTSEEDTALVLTPTRELGKQIMDIMHQLLGPKSRIDTAFLIGGEPMGKQFAQLKRRPRLVVGTPGRINDHLERGRLKLHKTGFLVLDETDRMLDMGFTIQIERILKYLPKQRQTLMFSATLPDNITKMAQKYLTDPVRVAVGSTTTPIKNIKQDVIKLSTDEKYPELVRQLEERRGSMIVFVKTKHGTERLAKKLVAKGFEAEAIHGDLKQSRRDRVIKGLRNKKYRILVATDVVARGLDIPHIEHVINYDLPQVPEDYIHRIGRTARAGAEGEALCLITPQDGRKWHAIEVLMNPDMKRKPEGKPSSHKRRKPGQKPWHKKSGSKFGKKPGHRSDGKPEHKHGSGNKPGQRRADGKPGHRADGKPGHRADGKPAFGKPGKRPAHKTGHKPGGKPSFGKPRFKGGQKKRRAAA